MFTPDDEIHAELMDVMVYGTLITFILVLLFMAWLKFRKAPPKPPSQKKQGRLSFRSVPVKKKRSR